MSKLIFRGVDVLAMKTPQTIDDTIDALKYALGINGGQNLAGAISFPRNWTVMGGNVPVWTMPDGTKTVHRPKDGAVVLNTDPNTGLDIYWQWDDFKESWFNVTTGPTTNHNTATFIVPPYQKDGYHLDNDFEIKKTPKCECGSDAVGSPRHSSWCQKYDSKQ